MSPRAILVFGILMAALLFISSEVTAREMAETAKEEQTKGAVADSYCGCYYRCCGRCLYGHCNYCCRKGEVPQEKTDAKPHN